MPRSFSLPGFPLHFDSQRRLHLLIQHEQMFDALALGRETRAAVESVHGAVERLMRPAQVRRHQVRVVEVGERRVRVGGAGVEHGLSQWFQPRQVYTLGRHRKGVVDEADGIAVIALEPPADMAQPRHVHGRRKQCEIGQARVREYPHEIARNDRRFQPADGRVLPALRTDFRNHQKRRVGEDVDVVESRRRRELARRRACAVLTVGADSGDPFPHERQPRQHFGRRVVQRQNPALATLQVLPRADVRP